MSQVALSIHLEDLTTEFLLLMDLS